MTVIVLAAGRGKRFGRKTTLTPKCLIPIGTGQTLLGRYLDSFRELKLKNIVIVVGHQKEKIKNFCKKNNHGLKITFVNNPRYRQGSLVSLFCASKTCFNDDLLIMDADVYFPTKALEKLIRSPKKTAFLIDARSKSTGEEMMLTAKKSRAWGLAKKVDPSLKILGEATGIFKISKNHALRLSKILRQFVEKGIVHVEYEESYQELMRQVRISYEKIEGFWSEMDFEEDLKKINATL